MEVEIAADTSGWSRAESVAFTMASVSNTVRCAQRATEAVDTKIVDSTIRMATAILRPVPCRRGAARVAAVAPVAGAATVAGAGATRTGSVSRAGAGVAGTGSAA